jgi:hypothetical protein
MDDYENVVVLFVGYIVYTDKKMKCNRMTLKPLNYRSIHINIRPLSHSNVYTKYLILQRILRILTNFRQTFVIISFNLTDKDLSQEKQ